MGFYGQDRIDLGDLVIELGLRYDRLNSGIQYPRVPGRAYSDPIKSANITEATKLTDLRVQRAGQLHGAGLRRRARAPRIRWRSRPATSSRRRRRASLSPTLRVSFPVTDRTGFRLSYSHQVQTPDMAVLASGTNSDLSVTQHQRRVRPPGGLRPDDPVRVRRPARVQRRHGPRRFGVQQGPVQRGRGTHAEHLRSVHRRRIRRRRTRP